MLNFFLCVYDKQKDRQFNWPKEEQAMIYKTLDRKLEIEQHQSHYVEFRH